MNSLAYPFSYSFGRAKFVHRRWLTASQSKAMHDEQLNRWMTGSTLPRLERLESKVTIASCQTHRSMSCSWLQQIKCDHKLLCYSLLFFVSRRQTAGCLPLVTFDYLRMINVIVCCANRLWTICTSYGAREIIAAREENRHVTMRMNQANERAFTLTVIMCANKNNRQTIRFMSFLSIY